MADQRYSRIALIACSDEKLGHAAQVRNLYTSERFKRETGRSPHQYLLQVRVERVREALRNTEQPLGEIAQNFAYAAMMFGQLHHSLGQARSGKVAVIKTIRQF